MSQSAKRFTRAELYSDANALNRLNADVSASLKDDINNNLGGPFFCGPNSGPSRCDDFKVIIKNPTPPANVIQAYSDAAAAQQNVVTAEQQAAAKVAAAQGDADSQRVRAAAPPLSPAQLQYIQAQALAGCAANPRCTMIVNGSSGGVNINTGP